MGFKRKIMSELLRWKNSKIAGKNHEALIIKGLRQVGKTYIAKQFGEENYENVVYMNFKMQPEIKNAFLEDLRVDSIMTALSLYLPPFHSVPGKTLLIMDEIQECPNARSSLRSFVLDQRYDVLATGSLLGIKGYNRTPGQGPSVGQENILTMTSMDFEEFLWAKGVNETILNLLQKSYEGRTSIPLAIHTALLGYYREYLVVGGMPEVVDLFLKSGDYAVTREKQRNLMESYRSDFGKFISETGQERTDKPLLIKLNQIMDSLPIQLAKDYKKFQFSNVDKNAKSDRYSEALQWLVDYGLLVPCFNLASFNLPLNGSVIPNEFKIYFSDVGLFVSQLEEGTASDIVNDNLGIYKGALYEEMVADAFTKNGRKLYYFRKTTGLEIDFVTRYQGQATLIEVKARNGKTKAANEVLSNPKYHVNQMIKLYSGNVGTKDNKLSLPYYLSFLIQEH